MNLNLALPSFLLVFATPDIKAQTAVDPPNIDQVTYSVNALLGRPPSEQRSFLIGSKMFDFTESVGRPVNGFNTFPQLNEISNTEDCTYKEQVSENWWAASSSSLEAQSSSSKNGFVQDTDISVSVPVKGVDVGVSTTIRNALVLGNSQTSSNSFSSKESGFTHSFSAFVQRNLYSVKVDYENIAAFGAWTNYFKKACRDLGENPTQSQLLEFFKKHGTHGLATASFGQKCTSTLIMEGGQSSDSYDDFHSKKSFDETDFLWWRSREVLSKENKESQSSEQGFKVGYSNRRCYGELDRESSCGGGMKGTGKDAPAIISWTFKPIWEMEVPGLTQPAKNAMKSLVEDIMTAAVKCAEESCNGRGTCASCAARWRNVSRVQNVDEFFNCEKCFCFDNVEGDRCDQQPLPSNKMSTSPLSKYINQMDGILEYKASSNGKRGAISGIYSIHDSHFEDRRFKFKTSVPESGGDLILEQKSGNVNAYDQKSRVVCPKDMALTYIRSTHDSDHEDRSWSYKCGKFDGWQVEQCYWTDYINEYDKELKFQCPTNRNSNIVFAGLISVHDNHREDRIFKFKCCRMAIAPLPLLDSNKLM